MAGEPACVVRVMMRVKKKKKGMDRLREVSEAISRCEESHRCTGRRHTEKIREGGGGSRAKAFCRRGGSKDSARLHPQKQKKEKNLQEKTQKKRPKQRRDLTGKLWRI